MHSFRISAVALAILTMPSMPAIAAVLDFTAARQHVAIQNPPGTGRCGIAFYRTATINPGPGVPSSNGMSNFGAFQATQSHCVVSPPPTAYLDGFFSYAFDDGDLLQGIYIGEVTAAVTPGFWNWLTYMTVTAGTGEFLGASGSLTDAGLFQIIANPEGAGFLQVYTGDVAGRLNLPAIPEPASWMMMIAGFALVGAAARSGRRPMWETYGLLRPGGDN